MRQIKKEFFEKIYINKQVVQEARIQSNLILGVIYEPFNSSTLSWRLRNLNKRGILKQIQTNNAYFGKSW